MKNTKDKLNIIIRNFKSIKEVKISLNKNNDRLIVIAGNNDVGKSNILEAIKKLNTHNPNVVKEDYRKIIINDDGEVEPIKEKPEFELSFLFRNSNDEIFAIEYPIKDETNKNILKNIKFTQVQVNDHSNRLLFGGHYPDAIPNTSFKKMYKEWKSMEKIPKSKADDRKIANLNFIESDLNIFKYNKLSLNLLFKNDDKENDDKEKQEQKKIIEIWEKISKVKFWDNKVKLDTVNETIKCLFKEFFEKEINYKFKIWIDDEKKELNISLDIDKKEKRGMTWNNKIQDSSDGTKILWSMILRLNSIDNDEPGIIMIDEPEKNLNPINQNHLLKYFKKIMKNTNTKRDNQVLIYTTHSPFMLDWDLYQNTYLAERCSKENSTILKNIYDVKDKEVPNSLLDKNFELGYIESKFLEIGKPKNVLFVEGITDYFVIRNIAPNIFCIPLFGTEYKKTASFHLPYIMSYTDNIKLLVDNDTEGEKIEKWFIEKTSLKEENISTYGDLFSEKKNLEEAITDPWYQRNKKSEDPNKIDKKIKSLTFNKENKDITKYSELIKFINKK